MVDCESPNSGTILHSHSSDCDRAIVRTMRRRVSSESALNSAAALTQAPVRGGRGLQQRLRFHAAAGRVVDRLHFRCHAPMIDHTSKVVNILPALFPDLFACANVMSPSLQGVRHDTRRVPPLRPHGRRLGGRVHGERREVPRAVPRSPRARSAPGCRPSHRRTASRSSRYCGTWTRSSCPASPTGSRPASSPTSPATAPPVRAGRAAGRRAGRPGDDVGHQPRLHRA